MTALFFKVVLMTLISTCCCLDETKKFRSSGTEEHELYSPPGSGGAVETLNQRQRGHDERHPPCRQMVQPDKKDYFCHYVHRNRGSLLLYS